MPIPESAQRIPRSLAREDAYGKLKQWIVDGTLQPGEALRDQSIAELLGVSRTPIREALRRLEDEGFVETALNRWTRVSPLDLNKAIETYSVIEALEAFALEVAQLTDEDLKSMAKLNEEMRRMVQSKRAGAALSYDEKFHAIWLARAHNRELELLVQQLKTRLRRVELAYWGRAEGAGEAVREHAAIVKALQKRSKRAAISALKSNWEGAKQRLRTVTPSEDNS
jgi:DNA-binding GntR family transcriptional regulator